MGVLYKTMMDKETRKQISGVMKRLGRSFTNTDNNYRNMPKTHGSNNSVKNFATSTKNNYKNMGK
jgi:hypothetical protein